MHYRHNSLLLCVLALCLTTLLTTHTVQAEDLELYTVRALSLAEVSPTSFEPQYAEESELQQLKQTREQQLQEEGQQVTAPQQSAPSSSSSSSSSPSSSTIVPEEKNEASTSFLLKDVVIHDSTMEHPSTPAMIEFEPLTPAEAMYYPYVQAQIQGQTQQNQQALQPVQTDRRKLSSRFLQVRAPAGESAGSPGYSSYAAVIDGSAPGYGSNPTTPMGAYRPLVNLYSDGTPYPLDMRKYDFFRGAATSTTTSTSATS